jgi:site-specific DNA-methyltransferase (adenine-specific)
MPGFPDESVDLIYVDPPFRSNRDYYLGQGKGKWGPSVFSDRWSRDIWEYINWMLDRLKECKRILKRTGSIYMHCDPHASHYLKVAMDSVFGATNFRNEIIWKRQSSHSDHKQGARHFGRVHDVILFYSRSQKTRWHTLYKPYTPEYTSRTFKHIEDYSGRRYSLGDLTAPGGPAKGSPKYPFLGVTRYWRYSKVHIQELYDNGRIVQTKPNNVPLQKRYLDEMSGVPIPDIWDDIRPVFHTKDSQGFPTQKPLDLLKRIIHASTDENDLILDPFCGSGTTLVAAEQLGRDWIGIDKSKIACEITRGRLSKLNATVTLRDPGLVEPAVMT